MIYATLSGSLHRDLPGMRRAYEALDDAGCTVLSPGEIVIRNTDGEGFVYLLSDELPTAEEIQAKHLSAIAQSDFLWVHMAAGYIGPSVALEIGFARATGLRVFSDTAPTEPIFRQFIERVAAPLNAVSLARHEPHPPSELRALQHYYARLANRKGWGSETAEDAAFGVMEELGELCREINLSNGHKPRLTRAPDIDGELADLQYMVVHLSNRLGLDLVSCLQAVARKKHP